MLSELYFYLWFPTRIYNRLFCTELWIAFRIVFLLMIPNIKPLSLLSSVVVNCFQNCIFTYDSQRPIHRLITNFVVNCFQNCIFTYDSQPIWWLGFGRLRCELLSELYFYLWFPTWSYDKKRSNKLWIAFRIVFLLMIPNKSHWGTMYGMRCELLSELYFYLWFPTFKSWR